jgi:hypothetical protein
MLADGGAAVSGDDTPKLAVADLEKAKSSLR